MASILNEIGFFQFDNLIRNRIPFVLLSLGVNLQGLYKLPLYQGHLDGLLVLTTPAEAVSLLQNRKHPAHEAVVVIAQENAVATALVDTLESQGYANVFYVKDGVAALRADASR